MCLLDLVEQDDGVRFSADGLGQLTAFLVTDISWRCSDQSGYRMFLHIFTHIDTNHVLLVIEEVLCECLCQLSLADTGRS